MTGDGLEEIRERVGRGFQDDSLGLTFTIRSRDTVLYERSWSITRVRGFDASRHTISRQEMRDMVDG